MAWQQATGLAVVSVAAIAFSVAACGERKIEVLECSGECSCDEDARSCSCAGGTSCAIDGAEDVTFYCDGNASCDLRCGVNCHVVCPGTTGCTVTLGDDGTGECQGNAQCTWNCDGNCAVECGGAARCTVNCADGCDLDGTTCRC